MNKLININEYEADKYYANTNKTYRVVKKELVYECNVCKTEITRPIKTTNPNRRGSIDYYLSKPCANCVKRKDALNNLLAKAKEKFPNNEFDYSLVTMDTFTNGFVKVPITCNKHNLLFETPLYNHTGKAYSKDTPNKGGCPECAKESQKEAETFTIMDWTTRLHNKFPHIVLNTALNSSDKLLGSIEVEFDCSLHGTFNTKFNYLDKCIYFCPLCAQDNNSWGGRFRKTDIKGTLYFIYIPLLKVWKLGVTKDTVEFRQKDLKYEYTIIWTKEFQTLKAAYAEETRLFQVYKDNRLKGVQKGLLGKAKGITELLNCSIPLTEVSHS